MDFSNKTAIVSGAASGMGLLFSENFASLGGKVVMCDVNADLICFIASDSAAYINGENIIIDGCRKTL